MCVTCGRPGVPVLLLVPIQGRATMLPPEPRDFGARPGWFTPVFSYFPLCFAASCGTPTQGACPESRTGSLAVPHFLGRFSEE